MSRTGIVIAVVCVALLGGAFVASSLLVSDVSPPPSEAHPVAMAPVKPARPVELDQAPSRVDVAAAVAPAPTAVAPQPAVAVAPAPAAAPTPATSAPADVAESPFAGQSPELEYAERIIRELKPDRERLQSAIDVLRRCVEQEPENARCQNDLELAERRMTRTGQPAPMDKPVPTLRKDKPLVRPWVRAPGEQ